MAPLPLAKLAAVLVKQIAKPASGVLVRYAKDHPTAKAMTVSFGQWLHWAPEAMLLRSEGRGAECTVLHMTQVYSDLAPDCDEKGYAGPSERTDQSIRRGQTVNVLRETTQPVHGAAVPPSAGEEAEDVAAAQPAAAQPAATGSTGSALSWRLVEWRHQGQLHRGWIPSSTADGRPNLRPIVIQPLSEEAALDKGATFLGEAFIFSVAGGIVLLEYSRGASRERRNEEEKAEKQALAEREAAARGEAIRSLQRQLQVCSEENRELQQGVSRATSLAAFGALAGTAAAGLLALRLARLGD
mmetsp:Transcript_31737/g.69343  ORF Transcript_31737/g.69343 Transcript_31737/m.69343 type:complete len:299 (+) Transcript_31737:51-947(+)